MEEVGHIAGVGTSVLCPALWSGISVMAPLNVCGWFDAVLCFAALFWSPAPVSQIRRQMVGFPMTRRRFRDPPHVGPVMNREFFVYAGEAFGVIIRWLLPNPSRPASMLRKKKEMNK